MRCLPARVYFIEAPEAGLVKIGASIDVASRLKALSAASPIGLALLGTVDEGGYILERKLHEHLIEHHSHGEWFKHNAPVRACISAVLAGSFDRGTLPEGTRAWALAWRRSGKRMSPNGRPYARKAAA